MGDVRLLVQEEGRAARNLVAFHVDVAAPAAGKAVVNRKPPSSPRLNDSRMTKRSSIVAKTGSRVRSASTGRDKKSELQARYWAFLFGNLQRAVDEIYQTCETDESVSECKEVILVLENFTRDFHNLIEWFKLKWEYENTPPPQRPTSLAWEVRKSSPGKVMAPSNLGKVNRTDKQSPAKKQLNFFNDVKLSSAGESPKKTFILENELSNQYGLKFGDVNLKEHLKSIDAAIEVVPNIKNNQPENKIVARIEENNKENYPNSNKSSVDEGNKPLAEVISSNQSSQTEDMTVQSTKLVLKQNPATTTGSSTKKPLAVKSSAGSFGKATTLSPLSINKTVSGVCTRKTVPVSPTNTVPPRTIPGRNVAAAAFVPGKKLPPTSQAKINTNLNKSTGNISKIQNSLQLSEKSANEDVKETSILDTNKIIEKEENMKNEGGMLKDNETNTKNTECVKSSKEDFLIDKNLNLQEKQRNVTETGGLQQGKLNVSVDKNDSSKDKPKEGSVKKFKPQKFDKNIQTDLSYLAQSEAAKQAAKTATLVRNKTFPSLTRKSSETLVSTETTLETSKVIRNNTINNCRSILPVLKKQTSTPESNVEKLSNEKPSSEKSNNVKSSNEKQITIKPAYAAVSKVYRSNTAIELRPSKVTFNRAIASANVKSEHNGKKISTTREKNLSSRNAPLLKKSNTLFKSEQNLQKKSSVDEDGWETVKGRNRWRLSQSSTNIKSRTMTASSRFHLPSPATSLPALALASEFLGPEPKPGKLHKDRQNQEIAKANKVALRNKLQPVVKQSVKTESDKVTNSAKKSKKEDITEKKSVVSDRKKISNSRVKDVKKIVNGNSESDEIKIDKLIDILSSEDERMNEEEIRKSMELYEKEKILTKEIQDLEKAEIEVDTETDDAETDGEATVGNEEDDTNCRISALKASYEDVCHQLSWADQIDTLEKLEILMADDTSTKGIPWSERLSTLEQLEELVARHPGRALELHQKLSSPSRRRPLPDTIQRHRARQASAQLKREKLLQDKSNKLRELLNKVAEVKMAQEQLKEERKKRIDDKLKRADEKRALYLRSIQRKAHDEEEKLREIAFINELEAQNKRHDFFTSCQEQQDRLHGIVVERQRKQEEKAAKEAAVEERRRIIEAERQEKLQKMQEKRRKKEERIGREQQEKEKERMELAREKARDREERLQALQAAQLANVEELQKKIQQKQTDSARRHEENIEHIRQRALESGALRGAADDEAPRITPYDTYKLCVVCNVLIESEVYLLSHLRGKAHQEATKDPKDDTEPVIVDAPPDKMDAKLTKDRERQKALRKRCKKIRSRMGQRGEEYLSKLSSEGPKKLDSPNKMRLLKCIRNVDKLHASQGLGQWPDNAVTLLERNLSEMSRILDRQNELDQKVFQDLNGFTTLSNILNLALDIPKNMSPYLPPKCFMTTCMVYGLACINNPDNSRFVFFSNKIALVLDLLLNRLNTLITDDYKTSNKTATNLPVDTVAGALMKLFALILSHAQEDVPSDLPDMAPRLQDIISYTVSVGVVDKLALYCSSVRDPIDNNSHAALFLLNAIQLLTTLAQTKCPLVKGDPTQLVATLRVTELVGAVSMLYGMLLHQGAPPVDPPSLPLHTISVTQATLRLLRAVAQLDLAMFQSVLGAEGISLQLRHIASYLLRYCSHGSDEDWLEDTRDLLHQVIEVVGYFAVKHYDNQMMLQSGHMPTVLQQLCNLPFEYFSDPSLSCHLLPTLLACCHGNLENRTILEQELSYQLLEDFQNSEAAHSNPLVQLIK